MHSAVGKLDGLVAVAERAVVNVNALPGHDADLGHPKVVPAWVVLALGDASVESSLAELLTPRPADGLGQGLYVVDRVAGTIFPAARTANDWADLPGPAGPFMFYV